MRLATWPGLRRRARRIVRVSRVVSALDRAEAFYVEALGLRRVGAGALDPTVAALLLPGATARTVRLRLGDDEVELVQWDRPSLPYPAGSSSADRWFQHLAIVVSDMGAAYSRLLDSGPRPISVGGPQALPPGRGGSAGVTAFKFRDPDGHPLELIAFPPGQGRAVWHAGAAGPFLGIDHSALSVGATGRSLRFYRRLGLRRTARTLNHGPAQAALDGLPGATVRVTGLRPGSPAGPGLELLGYQPPGRAGGPPVANAAVTDWVTLDTGGRRPRLVRDPDGHLLLLR